MSGFNDVTTTDGYNELATLRGPLADATIIVFDAPVFYQLATGNPPYFGASPEHKIPNGVSARITTPSMGVRVRSANPGQPAKVTVIGTPGAG